MNTFVKARFKDHPAINSAYMWFLTCSIASQSNIGIKELLDSLSKRITKVEKIAVDAATKESVTKVDNKVVALQRAANQGGGLVLDGAGVRSLLSLCCHHMLPVWMTPLE